MKLRYQADADLNERIVTGVLRREPSIDFQTASQAGFWSLSDQEVLELSAQQGRVLVSHDRKTMPVHFARFLERQNSPGLLIVSQKADMGVVIDDLILLWVATEAEDWINQVCPIPL